MPQRKILHVIPSLHAGGAERQLVNLLTSSSDDDLVHVVVVLGQVDFFGPVLKEADIEVIELGLPGKHPWFSSVKGLLPLVRKHDPDLIHSWLYDGHLVSRLVKLWNWRLPLVASLQSAEYFPEMVRAAGWPRHKIALMRHIDKLTAAITKPNFVACSSFVQECYIEHLSIPPKRIRVIYNSVSPSVQPDRESNLKLRRSLDIPDDAFVFINVGRLDPPKGNEYLIRAFHDVLSDVMDAYLVLVGDGPLKASLEELARSLGVEERVRFTGRRPDVGECLAMADTFVFPTMLEGLPLALLEAMEKKLPCIASDIAVIREVIEDGVSGVLVEPTNVPDFAHAMKMLALNRPLREKLRDGSERRVREHFYTEVLMPKWRALYRELAIHVV